MKLPTIFKQQSNKRYTYTPRYYDERKERLEELDEKHKKKSDETYAKGFRRLNYRNTWTNQNYTKSSKKSNTRLAVILIILFGITYFIIKRMNLEVIL